MSSRNNERLSAIESIAGRPVPPPAPAAPVEIGYFGEDVFSIDVMRRRLPAGVAKKLIATIHDGAPLDSEIAGDVAHAMKEWALERGATHFTHWFQPLTGGTAEKHDSFLTPDGNGGAIMAFSAKNLMQSEPDASSFPSGGLRSTFEARGYTAWDPTSPAFIKRHSNGATLCIPTAFFSYTGEVLDKKTPLLRSLRCLENAVTRLMNAFKLPPARPVVTLGVEQEYFLVDKRFYLQRPDLVQTGRTLFGAPPAKHQQLEDHYFGAIKPRVIAFMTEVERELWRLGIPAQTRHNEVAPAQFEIVPVFEEQNLAVDHNMLVMEVLRQVAGRNGLICLLHEKPFSGVNGSGKHNNWSILYGKRNLFDPGTDPRQNAVFLTMLAAVIRAIDLHSDLLLTATASAGNDLRLGANEAPPSVISIFLGDQLTEVIEQIERGAAGGARRSNSLRIGVDTLPTLPRDATDRNRTSPFAFTGNKFEFRALGASQSCSGVNMLLNTIVAESLDYFAERLEKLAPEEFNSGLAALLKKVIAKHKRVIFNGDNYSAAWREEAARRGLAAPHGTMESLRALLDPANRKLLAESGVLSLTESASRYEVFLEEYHRKLRIEGGVALELARSVIMPTAAGMYSRLAAGMVSARDAKLRTGGKGLAAVLEELGAAIDELSEVARELEEALRRKHEDILAALEHFRRVADRLESCVDDQEWPLPKYREMLFVY